MQAILKNYVVALFAPTSLIGVLLIIGLILLWRGRLKWAKILLTTGVLTYILLALHPFTKLLLHHKERTYPGFELRPEDKSIRFVVVLGGGYHPNPEQPLTTQLTRHTLTRLIEGIRIQRLIPGSKLVVTGKGWACCEGEAMATLAKELGVDPGSIITENESINTFDHTTKLAPILKQEKFVLVTSALHMDRALGMFKRAGFNPLPAPTAHVLTGVYNPFNIKEPFTRGDNLAAMDDWFMETCGYVIAKLAGKIQ